ncbi:hypothetical protein ON010_g7769 [Phytophthora cinnamomi]|nr:hypothetical protein ON010_g7769 [Phytophthora cinnamomi]
MFALGDPAVNAECCAEIERESGTVRFLQLLETGADHFKVLAASILSKPAVYAHCSPFAYIDVDRLIVLVQTESQQQKVVALNRTLFVELLRLGLVNSQRERGTTCSVHELASDDAIRAEITREGEIPLLKALRLDMRTESVFFARMLQRAAKSYRWLYEQQSGIVPSELGVFEFLVLCFEQVSIAGAAINCFQAVDFDGGDAPLSLPVVMNHVPQVLMVIVSLSLFIVWGTRLIQWSLRSAMLDCTCPMKFTTRRRYLPPVIALLKVFFLLYVTMTLNSSVGLEWKQQTSALSSALILVMCELVDAIAIAQTWLTSRARGERVYDWDVQEAHGKVTAKQLILTFFDRWKDCGMVSSFLNQSEMLLLMCEVPSMVWASWTCCQRGSTPERLSYQLHRYVTVMTIVMGMNVVEVSLNLNDDIAGAVVFFGCRCCTHWAPVVRRSPRASTPNSDLFPSPAEQRSENHEGDAAIDAVTPGECREVPHDPHRMQPNRSESVVKQCLELRRLGVWKKAILHGVPRKEWIYAFLDCAYSVLVVLNFYETTDAAEMQVLPNLLRPNANATAEGRLMDEVDETAVKLAVGFSTVLGISLLARWFVLYSSKRTGDIAWAAQRSIAVGPNYFAVGVVAAKLALLPASIYVFAVVLVRANLYTFKRGVNALVADLICAIAAARAVDSFGRALHGLGRSAVGLPGADAIKGSRNEKASIALQVFWDRFNDFLVPLGIVHLVISTTEVSKNFIVVYFLLVVCTLHAMIAYVDAVDITGAMYLAERLGYLVAVTFLVRNSAKYVERKGIDLLAPVILVVMEFVILIVALSSIWRAHRDAQRTRRELAKEDTHVLPVGRAMTRSVPMLASASSDLFVLSPSGDTDNSLREPKEEAPNESCRMASKPHWTLKRVLCRAATGISRLLSANFAATRCRRLYSFANSCGSGNSPDRLHTFEFPFGWMASELCVLDPLVSGNSYSDTWQVQEQILPGTISIGGAIVIALGTAATDISVAMFVVATWSFPIPFGYIIMVGPYMALVLRQQLKAQAVILFAKGAVPMAYPVFTATFYHLSGIQQTVFVVVLPLFKKITKVIIAIAAEGHHEFVGRVRRVRRPACPAQEAIRNPPPLPTRVRAGDAVAPSARSLVRVDHFHPAYAAGALW